MLQQTHFPLKQCLFFICLLCYLLLVLCFLSLILNWLIKLEDILHFHGTSMKISKIYFYSYLTFRLHFVKIFLIIACDCLYIDFKNLRTHNLALAVVSGGIINRWILFYTNAAPCSWTWNCVHLLVSQQTADFFSVWYLSTILYASNREWLSWLFFLNVHDIIIFFMVSIAAFGAIGLVMPLPENRTCTATSWPRRKVWNVLLTVIHSFIRSYQNSPYNNQNSISFDWISLSFILGTWNILEWCLNTYHSKFQMLTSQFTDAYHCIYLKCFFQVLSY